MGSLVHVIWKRKSLLLFLTQSFFWTQNIVSARTITSFSGRSHRSQSNHFVIDFMDEPYDYMVSQGVASVDAQGVSPLFYGFFFDGNASESLHKISQLYFSSCLNRVPEFVDFMEVNMERHKVANLFEYFRKPLDPNTNRPTDIYHVTAKFCGGDCSNYPDIAAPYLGKTFQMHIIGLFFTRKTFGLRLKLVGDQIYLFNENSKTFSTPPIPIQRQIKGADSADANNGINFPASNSTINDEQSFSEIENNEVIQEENGTSLNNFPEIHFIPQEENFHPSNSKAHTTIGCAPNVEAVQTGFDLRLIEALEISNSIPHKDFRIQDFPQNTNLPSATLRRFGDEGKQLAYAIYPRDAMIVPAIFNSYI